VDDDPQQHTQSQGTTAVDQRPAQDGPLLRGWIHAVATAALLATAPLLWSAAERGGPRLAVVIYLVGVGAMLSVSAIYHVPSWGAAAKRALRRADHSAIFLGIAGTYTPVLAVVVDGWFRVAMLATIWIGAAAGIAIANLLVDARPWVVATPYVALGWVALLLLPAMAGWSWTMTGLVLAGGVAYTLGAVVYARKRPDPWPKVFGFHELFHLLTVAAVALHWAAIWLVLT
jgi:hemolysin III